jgi:hypothetical protein
MVGHWHCTLNSHWVLKQRRKQVKKTRTVGSIVNAVGYRHCAAVSHRHWATFSYRHCVTVNYRHFPAVSYAHRAVVICKLCHSQL